jgi:hypothetical protein
MINLKVRKLAIEYFNKTKSYKDTCEIFKCSKMTLWRWIHNNSEPKKRFGSYKVTIDIVNLIISSINKNSSITLEELKNLIIEFFNITLSLTHISKIIRDNNYTRKIKTHRHISSYNRINNYDSKELFLDKIKNIAYKKHILKLDMYKPKILKKDLRKEELLKELRVNNINSKHINFSLCTDYIINNNIKIADIINTLLFLINNSNYDKFTNFTAAIEEISNNQELNNIPIFIKNELELYKNIKNRKKIINNYFKIREMTRYLPMILKIILIMILETFIK